MPTIARYNTSPIVIISSFGSFGMFSNAVFGDDFSDQLLVLTTGGHYYYGFGFHVGYGRGILHCVGGMAAGIIFSTSKHDDSGAITGAKLRNWTMVSVV